MKELFSKLRSKGLLGRLSVKREVVDKLSTSEIVGVAEEIVSSSCSALLKKPQGTFKHVASLELSAGSGCCAALKCRQKRLEQLLRFTAMYSDQVYIHNPFSDYAQIAEAKRDIGYIKLKFYNDLVLFLQMRSFLDAGLVNLLTQENHSCPTCFFCRFKLDERTKLRVKKATGILARLFHENTAMSLEWDGDNYVVHCTGPQLYYHSGGVYKPFRSPPKFISDRPRIAKRLHEGVEVEPSETLKTQIWKNLKFPEIVAMNVCFGLATSRALGTSFVTNNELHLSLMDSLTNDTKIQKRNAVAYNHLSSAMPFLDDVQTQNILKVRMREQDSFVSFRCALREAIREFKENQNMTRKNATVLYSDVIEPELARLGKKVKAAKKELVCKAINGTIATMGALAFGLWLGFLNTPAGALAGALGLAKVKSDIEKWLKVGDAEKSVQGEDMYFLWKVQQKAKGAKQRGA